MFGACDSHFHVQDLRTERTRELDKEESGEKSKRKLGQGGDIVRNCLQLLVLLDGGGLS